MAQKRLGEAQAIMAEGKKQRRGAKPAGRGQAKAKSKDRAKPKPKAKAKPKPKAKAKAPKTRAEPETTGAPKPTSPPGGSETTASGGVQTAMPSAGPVGKVKTLILEMFRTLKENAAEAVVLMLIGAAIGWLLNALMMMFRYEGFGVPPGAAATGESNLVSGSLFWIVASTLVFGIISYRRALGRERFWEEVRGFPNEIRSVVGQDGDRALVHLLWGFAGCMIITQLLSPSLSGVLAIALLVAVPSVLGDIISEMLQRIWDELVSRVAPTKRSTVVSSVATVVLVVGACLALAVAFFFAGRVTKLGLAVLAGVVAFVIGRASSSRPTTALWLIAAAAGAAFLGDTSVAVADDGGWLECGATIQGYLNCATTGGGTGALAGHALKGAIASLIGAGLGAVLGGTLGDPSVRIKLSEVDEELIEDAVREWERFTPEQRERFLAGVTESLRRQGVSAPGADEADLRKAQENLRRVTAIHDEITEIQRQILEGANRAIADIDRVPGGPPIPQELVAKLSLGDLLQGFDGLPLEERARAVTSTTQALEQLRKHLRLSESAPEYDEATQAEISKNLERVNELFEQVQQRQQRVLEAATETVRNIR